MLEISKEANPNYLCKVVELKGLKKHSNADRLQTVDINFNTVITGLDAKDGDVYVYFPVEGKISKDFLSKTNSFREKTLNADPEQAGFFEENCRVKAMRLRGERSMGYIVPVETVWEWAGLSVVDGKSWANTEFDTINGKKLVEKYVVKKREPREKQGKTPKVSRLIDGQVHLHVDTEQLQRNAHKFNRNDFISITYKTHGTSWWVSNVLVKRKLSWLEKLGQKLGLNIQDKEYDLIYGSRKVVKNKSFDDPKQKDHFYGYDLWEDIKNHVGENLPKGYSLYGEMLGYDKNGGFIQKGYDYGCKPDGDGFNEHNPQAKLEVYRVTHTNEDGVVTELDYPQMVQFCDKLGLKTPYLYHWGTVEDWLVDYIEYFDVEDDRDVQELFVNKLKEVYNEKDCWMCVNKVPEEGVVVRKENFFECDSYKLKAFRFLEWESKELDKGESDIESEN